MDFFMCEFAVVGVSGMFQVYIYICVFKINTDTLMCLSTPMRIATFPQPLENRPTWATWATCQDGCWCFMYHCCWSGASCLLDPVKNVRENRRKSGGSEESLLTPEVHWIALDTIFKCDIWKGEHEVFEHVTEIYREVTTNYNQEDPNMRMGQNLQHPCLMNMHVFGPTILMFTRVLRFCSITVAAVAFCFFSHCSPWNQVWDLKMENC